MFYKGKIREDSVNLPRFVCRPTFPWSEAVGVGRVLVAAVDCNFGPGLKVKPLPKLPRGPSAAKETVLNEMIVILLQQS